jgi:hypothetical protein
MSKSPRFKFIHEASDERVRGYLWDAMQLASTHDPDHAKELKQLGIDLRRALRWCERLFGRVGKLEQKLAVRKAYKRS